ncbi:MAG TPA: hypothetical protein VGR47_05895 [Terracidiphilus sp.]|nr:hypothetical protein [Terracidiphilus sp.]
MAGKNATQRRAQSGKVVDLYSAHTALGWRVVRQVPVELAVERVALRQWREVFLESGELAGVQPLKAVERKTLNQVLLQRLIAVTITNAELRRYCGLYGRSRTLGRSEWWREKRQRAAREKHGAIVDPEDAIERAIEKVRQWPYPASVDEGGAARYSRVTERDGRVYGDRAPRVYPQAR